MNSLTEVLDTQVSLFFRGLRFANGELTIVVGTDMEDRAEITFKYVRTFAFLKESDFYEEFRQYHHVQLASGRTLGVYRLTQGSILEQVLRGRLDAENPHYFWVSTPDECLEVISFSEPQVKLLTR